MKDKEISLEAADEFYRFLQGELPPRIWSVKLNLTQDQAFAVLWFLQVKTRAIPDSYEQCSDCKELFDSMSEGFYVEEGPHANQHFCDNCAPYEVRWPDEAAEQSQL